jgi:hypothetical protein
MAVLLAAVMIALALLASCGSSPTASASQASDSIASDSIFAASASNLSGPVYSGDGGKGKSITILPPKAVGFAANQTYLPGVVQGELVSNFSGYSAISVLDRAQLDSQYAELLSGYYDDNAKAGADLGHLSPTDYLLVGNITKTGTGYVLQIQITKTADKTTAASYSGTCTFIELENLSGVRRASLDLLQKLGVEPTERTKTELGQAVTANHAAAQVALAKGIDAMKKGTVVEALSYFIQSSNADPQLAEAASRVNITTANIASGNIGADVRNAIAWRKAWIDRLIECDRYVANYVSTTPLATYLVYSTDLKQGKIDWEKETLPISFTIELSPDRNWGRPITGVVDAVYAGLAGTGQIKTWELGWPEKSASNGPSQVMPEVTAKYTVTVQLFNDQGTLLGTQTVPLSAEWKVSFRDGRVSQIGSRTVTTVQFPAVDANRITDKLTIKVASLNGKSAEPEARARGVSILTQMDYAKLKKSNGWYDPGDTGPTGGIVFIVNDQRMEAAPASTEFKARWEDAIKRCESLKVKDIGGWHLPTKEELNAMYTELKKKGLGDFSNGWYWSSSSHEISRYGTWFQSFDDGYQSHNDFTYIDRSVRAVRVF